MATVFRAWDRESRSWRAVKLLAPRLARSASLRARFRKEAAVMARLEHPGIGKVFRLDMDGDQLYIEMELIEGCSLRSWLNANGPMPARLAVGAVVEVCAAMQFAHEAGVIHRDLKPANILVRSNGRCVVVDFGIARSAHAVSTTRTGLMMGSMGFMAPEQMESARRADERADVFSLAATLVALVTNHRMNDLDEALRAAVEHLPQGLMLTLVRATATNRDLRTGSARQLRRGLERGLDNLLRPSSEPSLYRPLPVFAS